MKNNILKASLSTLVFGIVTGFAFSGCSNNEDLNNVTPENGVGRVSFKISEKDFEPAEEVAGTRAAAQPQTELQDLGDGWQAEVSIVPDTSHREGAKAKTRAINTPTHYTIQAYQGGIKKGELKGTFNGSTFTSDAGQGESIQLPHGTYDFVCFNDKVTANGTQLIVNRANAANARYEVKRGVVINQDPKQYVAFSLKHAGSLVAFSLKFTNCKVHLKGTSTWRDMGNPWLSGYAAKSVNPTDDYQCTLESVPSSIPEKMNYDFVADTYSYPIMGNYSSSSKCDFGTLPSPGPSNLWKAIDGLTAEYFLPTTDCSKISLKFTSGSWYDRDLTGKTITIPTQKLVEANKKYNVFISLRMTKPQYLFSDGSVGDLDKNVGKTPVGVVLRPDENWAMALNDVTISGSGAMQWSNSTTQESTHPFTNYSYLFSSGRSYDNPYASIPAVQTALSYKDQVNAPSLLGIQQWQVASLRDFLNLGASFAGLPDSKKLSVTGALFDNLIPEGAPSSGFMSYPGYIDTPYTMNMTKLNKAFTDAGGTPLSGRYWMATEILDGGQAKQGVIDINSSSYHIEFGSKQQFAKIRPVIRFKPKYE